MDKKIKVLVLSDHPFSPSGVAHQTRLMIEGLLDTYPGKYQFLCFGGAIKHKDYRPILANEQKYGNDWVITPVDGYGTQELIRSAIRIEKPDMLWFMTDPRFFGWLWEIENEIRPLIPMIYYHVWDNKPYPHFNRRWYDSNDTVVTISKVTSDIVRTVAPTVTERYLPHACDPEIFKKIDNIEEVKETLYAAHPQHDGKFMFFWNNRNARRKQSGSLIWWFKKFLDEVGHDKAFLMMHTDPRDQHGQPLDYLLTEWGLEDGQVILSTNKVDPLQLAELYNLADCTINIADAEGFGLSSLESLSCETPVINTMTGGLQEQVTDGENWFGIGIAPASRAVIGSQEVPYIFEDRLSEDDVIAALKKMVSMKKEERENMGWLGRQHVLKNYSHEEYVKQWDETLTGVYEKYGSWGERKDYQSWVFEEVV